MIEPVDPNEAPGVRENHYLLSRRLPDSSF